MDTHKVSALQAREAQACDPTLFLCNGLLVACCLWLTDQGYTIDAVCEALSKVVVGLPHLNVSVTAEGAATVDLDPTYEKVTIDDALYHEFAFSMASTLVANMTIAGMPWDVVLQTLHNMNADVAIMRAQTKPGLHSV